MALIFHLFQMITFHIFFFQRPSRIRYLLRKINIYKLGRKKTKKKIYTYCTYIYINCTYLYIIVFDVFYYNHHSDLLLIKKMLPMFTILSLNKTLIIILLNKYNKTLLPMGISLSNTFSYYPISLNKISLCYKLPIFLRSYVNCNMIISILIRKDHLLSPLY